MQLLTAETLALNGLRQWLADRFASRVKELVLFGSRARGEGDEDSDLDVLVVVDDLDSGEAREIAHACGDLLTAHDVLVSPLALSTSRMKLLRDRERRIAAEIDREGIRL